jgi:BirA family biotin operon repressor/biotin-[acetyl-CoA-carboxylase] ligase
MHFRDRAIIRLETVDSTNNYAANLLRLSSPPDGTVITAQEQTHGKGQRGSSWVALKGDNLLTSMIVYPNFLNASNSFGLSQIAAIAVKETIESLCEKDVYIKWPNDIIVNNKKIAGILIEYNWADTKIQSAIIGCGININQRQFELLAAQSLRMITGRHLPTESVLDVLIDRFDRLYNSLKQGKRDEIRKTYLQHLYKFQEKAAYHFQNEIIHAVISDVADNGMLILIKENGEEIRADIKEISLIF